MARITFVVLAGCSVFFALDVAVDLGGSRYVDTMGWVHLLVETAATLGIIGALFLLRDYIRLSQAREASLEASLEQMRLGLNQLIVDRVNEVSLTPAEREVALLTIKGYSLAEIASVRGTSEGTAKAQAHAVYQKAGVSSRAELILHCIDDVVVG